MDLTGTPFPLLHGRRRARALSVVIAGVAGISMLVVPAANADETPSLPDCDGPAVVGTGVERTCVNESDQSQSTNSVTATDSGVQREQDVSGEEGTEHRSDAVTVDGQGVHRSYESSFEGGDNDGHRASDETRIGPDGYSRSRSDSEASSQCRVGPGHPAPGEGDRCEHRPALPTQTEVSRTLG